MKNIRAQGIERLIYFQRKALFSLNQQKSSSHTQFCGLIKSKSETHTHTHNCTVLFTTQKKAQPITKPTTHAHTRKEKAMDRISVKLLFRTRKPETKTHIQKDAHAKSSYQHENCTQTSTKNEKFI